MGRTFTLKYDNGTETIVTKSIFLIKATEKRWLSVNGNTLTKNFKHAAVFQSERSAKRAKTKYNRFRTARTAVYLTLVPVELALDEAA